MPQPRDQKGDARFIAGNESEKLAALARSGDGNAFNQLVVLYQHRIFGLTLMMVRDRQGAEDVTQDAFIRAYTHLELYDVRRPFYPWLATIAVRLAQNWLRVHALENKREGSSLALDTEPAANHDPLCDLVTEEKARSLWQSVAALPSGERTATFLFYRQEMKVSDIARTLGVTSGTVKTLLFRARRRLRLSGAEKNEPSDHGKER